MHSLNDRAAPLAWWCCFALVGGLACTAAKGREVCDSPQPIPDPEWTVSTPAEQGFDPEKLQLAADYAEANSSQCLVVVRHGVITAEWYWQGATPEAALHTWSLAKSYTSTLVGLAVDEGLIRSIDDPVSRYVPEWRSGGRDAITIRHLLSMTSGLSFDAASDSLTFFTAEDMTGQALSLDPSDPAGAAWRYSNQAVQVLEPVIRNATGKSVEDYAREHLWGPLGMHANWNKDSRGHASTYMNVLTSCRDHARFGQLFLRKGCWGSERILPSTWVTEATRPSSHLNRGYGLLWWLNGEAPVLDSVNFEPLPGGRYHPFAPNAFCASGLGGQMIEVIPSLDMVVVRAGWAPQEDPALADDPLGQLNATLNDGQQIIHNGVLERVLSALRP